MTRTRLVGSLLSRHSLVAAVALAVLVILAWAWLFAGAGLEMGPADPVSGDVVGHAQRPSMPMAMTSAVGWPASRLALTFAMWWVMMIAMMLPAAAPVVLLYVRAASTAGGPEPATASFLGGYLAIWAIFAGGATVLQAALENAELLSGEWMRSRSVLLTAALLTVAGAYQLSPAKAACLRHCQNPARFISRFYRAGPLGAVRMGAIHGAFCVGCCWLLMALLFVGGVMNLAWIAALTLLVAAEKLLPFGRAIPIATGVALIVGALALVSFTALD
jgi:predicted metal-binding membrane protein